MVIFKKPSATLVIVVATAIFYFFYITVTQGTSPFKAPYFINYGDIKAYFDSAQWIFGKGRLYVDYRCDYPVLAAFFFGTVRAISTAVSVIKSESPFYDFVWMWIVLASIPFGMMVNWSLNNLRLKKPFWILLAPGVIYFSLFRYDIYPAFFTFLGLLSLKEEKWRRAALMMGVALAFKIYPLFLLPTLLLFCFDKKGLKETFIFGILALAPFIVSNLVFLLAAGPDALAVPYRFQALRPFNGESSYDSIWYLASKIGVHADWLFNKKISNILSILFALISPFFLRARSWDELRRVLLINILGFMTLSHFYSPQFVVWLVPFLILESDDAVLFLGIAYGFFTYLYFPVTYDFQLPNSSPLGVHVLFPAIVALVMCLRMAMIVRLYFNLRKMSSLTSIKEMSFSL
jgi:uncharacterized membrane protein